MLGDRQNHLHFCPHRFMLLHEEGAEKRKKII